MTSVRPDIGRETILEMIEKNVDARNTGEAETKKKKKKKRKDI